MPLSPIDWTVVIVGRWNRAILTPAGIGKRLFGLKEGTPVEVMLAIDAIAPPRVRHDGIAVIAGNDRLIIQPEVCSFSELEKARGLAQKALDNLPETPISGIGVNIKYQSDESLDAISDALESEWDNKLSDETYNICKRTMTRSLKKNYGAVNVSMSIDEEGEQLIQFNFDTDIVSQPNQNTCLNLPMEEIEAEVKSILNTTIGLKQEDILYEQEP